MTVSLRWRMFVSRLSQTKQECPRRSAAASTFLSGVFGSSGKMSFPISASRLSRISATESRLPRCRIISKWSLQKPRRFVSTRTSGSIMAAPVM